MFRIWRERKVYDKSYVQELELLLTGQEGEPVVFTVHWTKLMEYGSTAQMCMSVVLQST